MKEFMYCFQISKLITFEVEYYTLGSNSAPYFSTYEGIYVLFPDFQVDHF
ncbi:MAG TPA: hypothetical protein [Bacteriophage sp.]|nr:MAG TPA: hypothetical protein [Bacteriophage sp.]